MNKSSLENAIRNDILSFLTECLSAHYEADVLPTSANELTMPVVDAEGNEKFALIKVSIPRGTRNGNGGYIPYDGYKVAEDYKEDLEDKAKEQAAKEAKAKAEQAKKEQKKAEKEQARAAKAALAELKKVKIAKE